MARTNNLLRWVIAVAAAAVLATCILAVSQPAASAAPPPNGPGVAAAEEDRLSVGDFHRCIIDRGDVRCWGKAAAGALGYGHLSGPSYGYGQFDIGDDEAPSTAGTVLIGGKAKAIAAGGSHTCALRADGDVLCWGSNINGGLGLGVPTSEVSQVGGVDDPVAYGPVSLGAKATAITAGENHTCALLANGQVRCWGKGADGRLGHRSLLDVGDDELPSAIAPVQLSSRAIQVSAGARHTCAVLVTGNVQCWGAGSAGQLGYGNTNHVGMLQHPAQAGVVSLGSGRKARSVSAGGEHTCAVLDDGTLRCWGNGLNGRLGYGNSTNIGDSELPSSVAVVDVARTESGVPIPVVQVSVGREHTCALLATGKVACWGKGEFGRLGYGSSADVGDNELPSSKGLVAVGGDVIAIDSGRAATCARLADGAVRCWGFAQLAGLGYGDEAESESGLGNDVGDDEIPASLDPIDLGTSPEVRAVTVGEGHSCALISDGTVRCWGYGGGGRLGYGNSDHIGDDEIASTAGAVDLGGGLARAVQAGNSHTCAVMSDGKVRCWGVGSSGQLGRADVVNVGDDELPGSVAPVDVGAEVVGLAGGGYHTCAIVADGTVRCWGVGANGVLGYGNTDPIGDDEHPSSAGPVPLGSTVRTIAAGTSHTCAILTDGTARCWGVGANGRLGYGNTADVGDDEEPGAMDPIKLGVTGYASSIVAGGAHTCAALDEGNIRCWGSGAHGRLGHGNTNSIGDDEVPMATYIVMIGTSRLSTSLAAGQQSCTIMDDGQVRCWGQSNYGQLGYGNTFTIGAADHLRPYTTTPVAFPDGRRAVALSARATNACAVLDNGTLSCWGRGDQGRLGHGNSNHVGDNEHPGAVGAVPVF